MTCNEVLEVLSDFVDGDVTPEVRARVIDHLRECQWCEQFGGRFAAIVEAVRRELREASPAADGLAERVRARLNKEAPE